MLHRSFSRIESSAGAEIKFTTAPLGAKEHQEIFLERNIVVGSRALCNRIPRDRLPAGLVVVIIAPGAGGSILVRRCGPPPSAPPGRRLSAGAAAAEHLHPLADDLQLRILLAILLPGVQLQAS